MVLFGIENVITGCAQLGVPRAAVSRTATTVRRSFEIHVRMILSQEEWDAHRARAWRLCSSLAMTQGNGRAAGGAAYNLLGKNTLVWLDSARPQSRIDAGAMNCDYCDSNIADTIGTSVRAHYTLVIKCHQVS